MSDLLCPWCGGQLPGEPGQYVKCRHCTSDFYWGDNKPWRTKMQAANASQVHPAGLSPPVEDAAPTPSESDFVPAESLPPPVPLLDKVDQQNWPPSWLERRRLKREEAEAKEWAELSDEARKQKIVEEVRAFESSVNPWVFLLLLFLPVGMLVTTLVWWIEILNPSFLNH